jgi:hypothetical protein
MAVTQVTYEQGSFQRPLDVGLWWAYLKPPVAQITTTRQNETGVSYSSGIGVQFMTLCFLQPTDRVDTKRYVARSLNTRFIKEVDVISTDYASDNEAERCKSNLFDQE